ncbi:phosphodiesterase [Vibrio sonorensis]|uniref:phosphodiesterase n=1 Tax=Vibrio sonorensis TaxID=1004316 RepID=UPI0008DA45FC|nr:phosphodiesterase [Vibrio sonorensis]
MKLFFASDLHGCEAATKRMLEAYKASGSKHLILLGDSLNHGPRNPVPQYYNPPAVAELLNEYQDSIIAVRGNCDSEVDQMLLQFPMMSDYAWLLLESGKRLFLTHGHLYNGNKLPPLRDGDVIVHGHTHIPLAQSLGSHFIFNPGSTTFPREGYKPSYGLLENDVIRVVSFDGETIVQSSI